MSSRLVILLGPPACGKGTQARLLSGKFGWRAFSTGVAIRSHVTRATGFGLRAKQMLGTAYLLPDSEIIGLVREELKSHSGGLVLDGFPRTLPQAELFDSYCAERGWDIDAVIFFDAGEADLIDRIYKRITCMDCGGTFTAGVDAGAAGDACPDCGGGLTRRKDDLPDVFAERFTEYRNLTYPLVDYYARRGILHTVPALGPPAILAENLQHHLASLT